MIDKDAAEVRDMRIDELREKLATLPKTQDGEPILPGMRLWCVVDGAVGWAGPVELRVFLPSQTHPSGVSQATETYYSSAAMAVQAAMKKGKDDG